MHHTRWQARGQRSHQARQPVAEGDEHAIAGAAFAVAGGTRFHLAAHGANQAAVNPFHFTKTRQRRFHAQFFHVGRIDRAHQGLDEAIEDLASQPAADEAGHAFVARVFAGWNDVFQRRTHLARRTQQRRDGQRPHLRRGHHKKPVGQPIQPATVHHERPPAGRVGLHELIGQAESLAQFHPPRDGGDEVVGALFDLKTVAVDRGKHPPQPCASLQ